MSKHVPFRLRTPEQKARHRAANQRWREAHPDAWNALLKRYRHLPHRQAAAKRWQQANRDKLAANTARWKAKLLREEAQVLLTQGCDYVQALELLSARHPRTSLARLQEALSAQTSTSTSQTSSGTKTGTKK